MTRRPPRSGARTRPATDAAGPSRVRPAGRSESPPSGPLTARQAAIFVAVITAVAFLNSFAGTFVFDDIHEIQKNPALERLWPPWEAMFEGNRVPARPLPYLSFAVDRAVWGARPFGFHVTNLLVHGIAALAVFELVRLALQSPRLDPRWAARSVPLALVIAMIWAVHPLQTQAVTYIYQRIESLTGMFCTLSRLASARAATSGWPAGLLVGSVAAAAAAMASKENAVVLPLLILAYGWFFVVPAGDGQGAARGWLESLWPRRWYFAALAGTWILIGLQLATQRAKYQEFTEASHTPLVYALTQPGVILHYLRLVVWPVGQRIDYSVWPVVTSVEQALPAGAVLLTALVATVVGTVARRPWAWLGVVFFLTLAPTSSIMPIEAVANEHRMYLALAAVVSGLVLGVVAAADVVAARRPGLPPRDPRIGWAAAAAVIMALVLATQLRNQLYSKVGGIWLDVLAKDPDNHRANWMLASILDGAGETEAAIELAERSIRSRPTTQVFSDLAGFHSLTGDQATAERLLRRGLALQQEELGPDHEAVLITTVDLAVALRSQGRLAEADTLCRESLPGLRRELGDRDPAVISCLLIMAAAAAERGELAAAEAPARAGLHAPSGRGGRPDAVVVTATVVLADVLRRAGRPAEAEAVIRRTAAALARSDRGRSLDTAPLDESLAAALADAGRLDDLVALRRR
ncbi:MAG: tetratricopeptide repeat protein, partial [Planctomycetia bacterium]